MKNAYLLGILAVCLTACGGGGGSGSGNNNVASTPINNSHNASSNNQSTSNTLDNTSNTDNPSGNSPNTDNTSGNSPNTDNTSGNNPTTGNTSGNNPNTDNTSGNSPTTGNTSGNNPNTDNTSGKNPNIDNTSGNNSNTGNSDNLNRVTVKNSALETENLQNTRYILNGIDTKIEYGRLKLAQDNIYLTPAASTQSISESFKVKPMTESQKQSVQEVVDYTNKLRAEKGLTALVLDNDLTAFAQRRAEELAGRYAHERPDNSSIFDQGLQGGGGENIATGYKTALDVSKGWKNSSGHYANMIEKGFTKIGIGVVSVPGSMQTYQWVQIFGDDTTSTPYHFDEAPAAVQTKLYDATAKIIGVRPNMNWIALENGNSLYIADIPSNGEWHQIKNITDTKTYNALINSYDDVRFGALKDQDDKYQVFYRGNNTIFEEIPISGIINYNGKAFMTDGNSTAFLNSAFQADFSNKKLDGVLSQEGNNLLDIHAVIRGSSFHSNPDAKVETQGSFFGPKATELGGVFYEHNSNRYGSYGAKQK
ncbi:CAP domain-containing protein [Mannheimia indoligenes]|uniref:CAP domain-containing protein n=1 Tax=Mannheimia indoligenes TaxID=3103145 RepID=UPI002FE52316